MATNRLPPLNTPEDEMTHDKEIARAQVAVLNCLKSDVRGLDFEKLSDDGHTMLISKPQVLEFINDWIAECLDPTHTAAK